jgi:hypothetical protein
VESARAVAAHPALFGGGATAPDCDVALGMNTLDLDGAAPDFAPVAAVAFIGTPGADKTLAGRVIDAAVGAADFPGAVIVGVALVADSVATALPFAVAPGAAGEPAGEDGATDAVIE